MTKRTRVLLPLAAAVASSAAIISCATKSQAIRPVAIDNLRRLEASFVQTVNEAIRAPSESSFAAHRCPVRSIISYRVQQIPPEPGVKACALPVEGKQELRDALQRWADDFHLKHVAPAEFEQQIDGETGITWFTWRIMLDPKELRPDRK